MSRPTVFVGGYYYPSFYRASLWYDPFFLGSPGYYGYYGYGYGPCVLPVSDLRRGRGYDRSGSIRLQVSPRQAEVFVDGYFAGTVDDFDGVFQRLNIEPGEHEIQVYLAGYRSFSQRFYLQPGKSFNIKHTMEPLGPARPRRRARTAHRPRVRYLGPWTHGRTGGAVTAAGAVAAQRGRRRGSRRAR